MTHLAGKSGNVFIADLLLEDCEDNWDTGAHATPTLETTIVKVGSGSVKIEIDTGIQAGEILAYETMSPTVDFATLGYDHILCWAYSTVLTAAADYRICISTSAGAASAETLVDLPIIPATTWKYCHCTEVTGDEMADTSAGEYIGLESNANGLDGDIIYLDDIRAARNIAGIGSWSLDYVTDAIDVTDFGDAGVRAYVAGPSGWSGTFEGFKDGAPLTIGSQYGIELAESATVTQAWLGNAILTGVHPTVAFDGIVSYSYDFQGVGVLTIAST